MAEVTLQTKVWGETEALLVTPTVQLHRINFLRGGVCSRHYHKARFNAFYVLAGRLKVVQEYHTAQKETLLLPGDLHVVAPGVIHCFEGLTEGRALELYYMDELSEHDIVRLTQGFCR